MRKELAAVRRVAGSRWFSGFATAVVVLGAFAAAGLSLGGVGESAAAQTGGMGQIRVKFPWMPGPGEWIEIDSFQWGVQRSSTRPESGPPSVSEIVITKVSDTSSVRIHQALARGEHLDEVVIQFCKQDCDKGIKYMEIVLKDALITSYQIGGSAAEGPLPTESVSFNYGKISFTYFKQDKKNEPTGIVGWDCSSWPQCVPD